MLFHKIDQTTVPDNLIYILKSSHFLHQTCQKMLSSALKLVRFTFVQHGCTTCTCIYYKYWKLVCISFVYSGSVTVVCRIQLYKGFPWITGWIWPIWFRFTIVPNGDSGQLGLTLQLFPMNYSGQSGLTLQLFPIETIVTPNLIGQNNPINQWKCFKQSDAGDIIIRKQKQCPGRQITAILVLLRLFNDTDENYANTFIYP